MLGTKINDWDYRQLIMTANNLIAHYFDDCEAVIASSNPYNALFSRAIIASILFKQPK